MLTVRPTEANREALRTLCMRHDLRLLSGSVHGSWPKPLSCDATWDGTVRHLGQDSSALRSELSLGHFGTSADLSGQFGPTKLVPVSWVRSVRNSRTYTKTKDNIKGVQNHV